MERHSIPATDPGVAEMIDYVLAGDEVVFVRNGQPVARVVAEPAVEAEPEYGSFEWLVAGRKDLKPLDISSVELLRQVYEEPD